MLRSVRRQTARGTTARICFVFLCVSRIYYCVSLCGFAGTIFFGVCVSVYLGRQRSGSW